MASFRYRELEMSVPESWNHGTQLLVVSPPQEGFRPTLAISHEARQGKQEAAEYAGTQLASLQSSLTGFGLLREGTAKFGELAGFFRECSFVSAGAALVQVQLYVVLGGVVYTLTYTDLADRRAAARAAAEKLFASTRLAS